MKIKQIIYSFICLFLIGIISLNFFILNKNPDIFTQTKIQLFSLNQGDSYSGRLNLWRLLVQNNDWVNAAKLEPKLNSSEISDYKFNYQPSELQKKVDYLNSKSNKSVEDLIELARVQFLLNQKQNSLVSIQKARQLDPIRDDIDRLYYSLSK
ncbi:MAG: hypothetical protein PHP97_00950 [Candidatus Shapirobacteria bacterium]|nr:hypothetical protein [Candidatus Shapirobacteria bacterium]MDD3002498.1 hypothetical protein [Candidatus Shapirobacteria bacterium]MDD4383403.1 hypothetical protein [Candidatus Shapirobacteria bacterium]